MAEISSTFDFPPSSAAVATSRILSDGLKQQAYLETTNRVPESKTVNSSSPNRYTLDDFLCLFHTNVSVLPELSRQIGQLTSCAKILSPLLQSPLTVSKNEYEKTNEVDHYYKTINHQKEKEPNPSFHILFPTQQLQVLTPTEVKTPPPQTQNSNHPSPTVKATAVQPQPPKAVPAPHPASQQHIPTPDAKPIPKTELHFSPTRNPKKPENGNSVHDTAHTTTPPTAPNTKRVKKDPFRWPADQVPRVPATVMEGECWQYLDMENNVHGPFSTEQMRAWYEESYMEKSLWIHLIKERFWFPLCYRFPEPLEPFKDVPIMTCEYGKEDDEFDWRQVRGLTEVKVKAGETLLGERQGDVEFGGRMAKRTGQAGKKIRPNEKKGDVAATFVVTKTDNTLATVEAANGRQQTHPRNSLSPPLPSLETTDVGVGDEKTSMNGLDAGQIQAPHQSKKSRRKAKQTQPKQPKMEIFAGTTQLIGDEMHFCMVVKGESLTIPEQTILKWSEYFYAQALEGMTEEARMAMSDFEMRALTHSCRQEAIKYLMPFAQEMAAKQRQELAQHQAAQFVMMTESMRGGVEAEGVVGGGAEERAEPTKLKADAKPFQPRFKIEAARSPLQEPAIPTGLIDIDGEEKAAAEIGRSTSPSLHPPTLRPLPSSASGLSTVPKPVPVSMSGAGSAVNLEEYTQQCLAWTEAEIAGFLGEGNAELALRLLQTQTPKELEQMATAALGDSALTSMFVAELTRLKTGPEGQGVTRS
ncbi:hypothetical protein BLNAU_9533 [Blattamonas nauphoetae]|uniref:GYF domain-containing protein n=1 Tax=Blattamonas nauphoetae TaxID=2049346 RepID=A0ABQ9XVJ8_9EUKA|nr:hypothetical protein BLNAU_9533 [Blattamonas nauphoetae]